MTRIKKLADEITDEICGTKSYAENYVERKARGDMSWANRFKEMANDELKHAMWLHELAEIDIAELSSVFNPPAEMVEEWDRTHKKYVEKSAWVKMMLDM